MADTYIIVYFYYYYYIEGYTLNIRELIPSPDPKLEYTPEPNPRPTPRNYVKTVCSMVRRRSLTVVKHHSHDEPARMTLSLALGLLAMLSHPQPFQFALHKLPVAILPLSHPDPKVRPLEQHRRY